MKSSAVKGIYPTIRAGVAIFSLLPIIACVTPGEPPAKAADSPPPPAAASPPSSSPPSSSTPSASTPGPSLSASGTLIEKFRILVLPVTVDDGKEGGRSAVGESESLRTELISALVNSKKADVIDRQKTEAALAEIVLGESGAVDPSTAPRLGRLTGAQKMVSLVTGGGKISVTLTDIETGKTEFSYTVSRHSFPVLRDELIGHLEYRIVLTNMAALKSRASDLVVKIVPSKRVYRKNDPVSFEITLSEDAYLYILILQNDGEIFLLYPNEYDVEKMVPGGKPVTIPGKESRSFFAAGEPYGTDVIKAIASRTRLQLFPLRRVEGTPFSAPVESPEVVTRGIQRITTGLKPSDWNSAEVSIETTE